MDNAKGFLVGVGIVHSTNGYWIDFQEKLEAQE